MEVRSNKIFISLRNRIIYGDYPPGMSLSEKDLCEEFNVSRTPLREAIMKLKDIQLVNAIPGFGTHVTPIDISEIRCAFEVKMKLEELIGELAAERINAEELNQLEGLIKKADRILKKNDSERHRHLIEIDAQFHEIMCHASQNNILQEFQDNIHSRCARLWSSSLSKIVPNKEVIDQLRAIHAVVKKGDKKRAGQLMAGHVQYFIDKVRETLI